MYLWLSSWFYFCDWYLLFKLLIFFDKFILNTIFFSFSVVVVIYRIPHEVHFLFPSLANQADHSDDPLFFQQYLIMFHLHYHKHCSQYASHLNCDEVISSPSMDGQRRCWSKKMLLFFQLQGNVILGLRLLNTIPVFSASNTTGGPRAYLMARIEYHSSQMDECLPGISTEKDSPTKRLIIYTCISFKLEEWLWQFVVNT